MLCADAARPPAPAAAVAVSVLAAVVLASDAKGEGLPPSSLAINSLR